MKIDFVCNYKEILLFDPVDKKEWWGEGEWVDEHDFIEFTFNGYKCEIRRIAIKDGPKADHMFGGHLCGYVLIPSSHRYHHKKYEDMGIDCHYGLTFGEVTVGHWIGFDCAHSGDFVPSIEHSKKNNKVIQEMDKAFPLPECFKNSWLFNPIYRNMPYCVDQCKSIVMQLIEADKHEQHQ